VIAPRYVLAREMLTSALEAGTPGPKEDTMNKTGTKKATTAKKIEDLVVKDSASVTGGLSLNFTKVEYSYKTQ
jgi:hypothetical protein